MVHQKFISCIERILLLNTMQFFKHNWFLRRSRMPIRFCLTVSTGNDLPENMIVSLTAVYNNHYLLFFNRNPEMASKHHFINPEKKQRNGKLCRISVMVFFFTFFSSFHLQRSACLPTPTLSNRSHRLIIPTIIVANAHQTRGVEESGKLNVCVDFRWRKCPNTN